MAFFDPLLPFCADVITIDPPWDFKLYSEAGAEKSASAHYDTMSLEQIRALPVGDLARGDCLLLLWGCEWIPLEDRGALLKTWGFTYKSTFMWRKTTRKGKVRMGPGYRVRTMHEPVHLAVMGNPQHKAFHSIFDGVARQHSRKPEEFYKMVVRHTPRALCRLDLFSRQTRPGWTAWGWEAQKFDAGNEVVTRREKPQRIPDPMPLFPEVG